MAWGTRYRVSLVNEISEESRLPDGTEVSEKGTEGITGKQGAAAIFLYRKNNPSIREIFKKDETYHLIEKTVYTDGREAVSDRLSFTLAGNASIGGIDMKDQPTHVTITKTDITGTEEIPGARLIIKDKNGNTVEEWTSTKEPHELIAVLKPGETYFLEELAPPSGYAYSEVIEFTVSDDGSIDQIQIEDKVTRIEINKISSENEQSGAGTENLRGAILEIRDAAGNTVERFTSTGKKHIIIGKLNAGEVYTLVEISAPPGYHLAEPVLFTVSTDGRVDQITMEDPPTKVIIEKHGISEDGKEDLGPLTGAVLEIRDSSDMVTASWVSNGKGHVITGKLTAGRRYSLVETAAPAGYQISEPVSFTVTKQDTAVVVRMVDKKKPEDKEKPEDPAPKPPEEETTEFPPEPELKVNMRFGYITAEIGNSQPPRGYAQLSGRNKSLWKIPGTGDKSTEYLTAAAFLALLACVAILWKRRRARCKGVLICVDWRRDTGAGF